MGYPIKPTCDNCYEQEDDCYCGDCEGETEQDAMSRKGDDERNEE